MKKIITMAIITILATINVQAETTNVEMCKTFIKKAKDYQATINNDELSKATLAFYKDEVVGQCGNIASKMTYKKNFFATQLMKKDIATVNNCKLSIKMAKSYDETTDKSFIVSHAHKVNIVDNCGTLMAKKAPAFCLFDVVDNSNTDALKDKCIASIEKAHANMGSSADFENKGEVLKNCGRLHATM